MQCYLDPNYGADADGKRSTPTWFYEFDQSDDELILDQLKDFYKEFDPIIESMPEIFEVQVINPFTEDDVGIDISTEPYLNALRTYKLIDKTNYESFIENLIRFQPTFALQLSLKLIEELSKPK